MKIKIRIKEVVMKIKIPQKITKSISKIVKKYYLYIVLATIVLITIGIITTFVIIRNNSNLERVYYIEKVIGKTITKKHMKVEDVNGDFFYVPKGFKVSDNLSEQTVKNGLVIIDDTGDKQTTGSEFVWIPVSNIDSEAFEKTFVDTSGSIYKTLDLNLLKENKDTKEYLDMKDSIYKYGGFYVSRYEAGISDKLKEELEQDKMLDYDYITKDTTEKFASGKYKPVSKKDTIVWNYISWGGTFKDVATDGMNGNDKEKGAVKVARGMYDGNMKTSVKSSLCYASNWDAIMNFIDEKYYTNSCEETSVVINSTDKGNYYMQLQKTGSSISYYTKNICDLSGNVYEWTMESFNDVYRTVRGGSYATSGNVYTISSSKEFYPNDYSKEIGFRVVMWLK